MRVVQGRGTGSPWRRQRRPRRRPRRVRRSSLSRRGRRRWARRRARRSCEGCGRAGWRKSGGRRGLTDRNGRKAGESGRTGRPNGGVAASPAGVVMEVASARAHFGTDRGALPSRDGGCTSRAGVFDPSPPGGHTLRDDAAVCVHAPWHQCTHVCGTGARRATSSRPWRPKPVSNRCQGN